MKRLDEERSAAGLQGRIVECAALNELVRDVRAGQSRVVVMRGEAGVGKSALLEYTSQAATGFRVSRTGGVESEMELAYAGLHQLCAPFLGRLDRLPGPQRDALATAFGFSAGNPPDRFLVGLATLSLLADVAEERPLVCLVDDAHWLDRVSAQTLAFVARRLLAERIALAFAVREPTDERVLDGLPEMLVGGLSDTDARALLATAIPGRMDERVRDRIIAESRGNPLALLELPRGLSPTELAGGFGRPDARPLAGRIEQSFQSRLSSLPLDTRRLLLAAAAEPLGDAALLWRAAERLSIDVNVASAAEAADLIQFGTQVRFRHPLVRSTVYRGASPEDRRTAHWALAEATDPLTDPDRRAWHRAQATVGTDEEVAAALEESAGRAQARGGLAAAAAFLEQAAALTPEPARRATRALAAAQAAHVAGGADSALTLLSAAAVGPLDDGQQARVELLRAQIAFTVNRGRQAPPLLLEAARRLEPLDAMLARETYLEALGAEIFAGRLRADLDVRKTAEAARAAPPAPDSPRATDLLLDGLARQFTDGYADGLPFLRRALDEFAKDLNRRQDDLRWLWLAWPLANEVWDDEAGYRLIARAVRLARDAGALTVLPIALLYSAGVHGHVGEFTAASALVDEATAINQATGNTPLKYVSPVIAAWEGQENRAQELIEACIRDATARGEGRAIGLAEYARAVLFNGLGQYERALDAAQRACEREDLGLFGWSLSELIESAARSGHLGVAEFALQRLEERTQAADTNWARGIQARSHALVSTGEAAELLYQEAIACLTRTRIRLELARVHLLYGEWLRRENRRLDARHELRIAEEMFSAMGVNGFAERTRRELLATGETVRKRNVETINELTPQEAQIARLAVEGRTNPEIGAELFLSPRTVEWHLRKVYPKLGITSRRGLKAALTGPPLSGKQS